MMTSNTAVITMSTDQSPRRETLVATMTKINTNRINACRSGRG